MLQEAALLLMLTALTAEPPLGPYREDILGKIERSKTITLAYHESARPFSFANRDGEPAGYSVDICTLVVAGIGKQLGLADLRVQWVKITPAARAAGDLPAIDLECGTRAVLPRAALAGLTLRRGDPYFRQTVNRALAALIRSRDIGPVVERWFGRQRP